MKRILSVIIAAVMLMSAMVITSGAAGSLIFSDNFDMGFKPANWIQGSSCAFEWDDENQCIQGYGPARVLQSNYSNTRDPKTWDKFYASFDFQIRGFDDMVEATDVHTVGIWVRDLFEQPEGSLGPVYIFFIEIDGKNEDGTDSATSRAYVRKEASFSYRDENNILQQGTINQEIASKEIETKIEVGEKAPWYDMGVRIDSGKLQFYFQEELIFSFEANAADEKIGDYAVNNVDATIGSQKTPVLLFASKSGADLWIGVDNFEVWTPDYDFADVTYGDVNGDTKINLSDVSKLLQFVAKWDVKDFNEAAADVNGDSKVNLTDASRMLQYIAKWDVKLGA